MEVDVSTPLCHRTFAIAQGSPTGAAVNCAGSKCALWSPEVELKRSIPRHMYDNDPSAEGTPGDRWAPLGQSYNHAKDSADIAAGKKRLTGRGLCADNLHREPWPDSSAGEGGG